MNRAVLGGGFLSNHPYFRRIAISDENHPNNFQIFILKSDCPHVQRAWVHFRFTSFPVIVIYCALRVQVVRSPASRQLAQIKIRGPLLLGFFVPTMDIVTIFRLIVL